MIDYIPENFWKKNIRVLDPCAGIGKNIKVIKR